MASGQLLGHPERAPPRARTLGPAAGNGGPPDPHSLWPLLKCHPDQVPVRNGTSLPRLSISNPCVFCRFCCLPSVSPISTDPKGAGTSSLLFTDAPLTVTQLCPDTLTETDTRPLTESVSTGTLCGPPGTT